MTIMRGLSPFERVMARTNFDGACWEYEGPRSPRGYGTVSIWDGVRSTTARAHRVVWEHLVGPISPSMVLDHLCRNTSCVNPDHLEPVTQAENVHRGYAPTAVNARKTHCKRGHEFTPENTYYKSGRVGRQCRTCTLEQSVGREMPHLARQVQCPACGKSLTARNLARHRKSLHGEVAA